MTRFDRLKPRADPYHLPAASRGDRTIGVYRGADVIITRWKAVRIPWPSLSGRGVARWVRVQIGEELARVVRTESAEAIMHWCGVTKTGAAALLRHLDNLCGVAVDLRNWLIEAEEFPGRLEGLRDEANKR